MSKSAILVAFVMVSVGLSGCLFGESGPGASFAFQVTDDSGTPLTIEVTGLFALHEGSLDEWESIEQDSTTLSLLGTGDPVAITGGISPGSYDALRVVYSEVLLGNDSLPLAENGFDLPVPFAVSEGGLTIVQVSFQWERAVFQSAEGKAFRPLLRGYEIVEDGTTTAFEDAGNVIQIQKDVVARMRVFDSKSVEVFRSDFEAGDQTVPAIGNAGLIALSAAESETLKENAELVSFHWDIDGMALTGLNQEIKLEQPRNYTITLTVTDSEGISDVQTVVVALKPGVIRTTHTFSGLCSGVLSVPAICPHEFEVDVNSAIDEDGNTVAANLTYAEANIWLTGTNAPSQDLDLDIRDAADARVDNSGSGGSTEHASKSYNIQGPHPASGTWVIEVEPFAATAASYAGSFSLEWQLLPEDPGYLNWMLAHDDGHNHNHDP